MGKIIYWVLLGIGKLNSVGGQINLNAHPVNLLLMELIATIKKQSTAFDPQLLVGYVQLKQV